MGIISAALDKVNSRYTGLTCHDSGSIRYDLCNDCKPVADIRDTAHDFNTAHENFELPADSGAAHAACFDPLLMTKADARRMAAENAWEDALDVNFDGFLTDNLPTVTHCRPSPKFDDFEEGETSWIPR